MRPTIGVTRMDGAEIRDGVEDRRATNPRLFFYARGPRVNKHGEAKHERSIFVRRAARHGGTPQPQPHPPTRRGRGCGSDKQMPAHSAQTWNGPGGRACTAPRAPHVCRRARAQRSSVARDGQKGPRRRPAEPPVSCIPRSRREWNDVGVEGGVGGHPPTYLLLSYVCVCMAMAAYCRAVGCWLGSLPAWYRYG